MSDTKIMIFNQTQNFLKNFNNIAENHLKYQTEYGFNTSTS